VNQWWTDEQVEFMQGLIGNEVMKTAADTLRPAAERINRAKGLIRMTVEVPDVNPPAPLFEPNDMIAVASPCHPLAPIKVYEDWMDPLYCIIDGAAFTVAKG
jgi:hypothetical protein